MTSINFVSIIAEAVAEMVSEEGLRNSKTLVYENKSMSNTSIGQGRTTTDEDRELKDTSDDGGALNFVNRNKVKKTTGQYRLKSNVPHHKNKIHAQKDVDVEAVRKALTEYKNALEDVQQSKLDPASQGSTPFGNLSLKNKKKSPEFKSISSPSLSQGKEQEPTMSFRLPFQPRPRRSGGFPRSLSEEHFVQARGVKPGTNAYALTTRVIPKKYSPFSQNQRQNHNAPRKQNDRPATSAPTNQSIGHPTTSAALIRPVLGTPAYVGSNLARPKSPVQIQPNAPVSVASSIAPSPGRSTIVNSGVSAVMTTRRVSSISPSGRGLAISPSGLQVRKLRSRISPSVKKLKSGQKNPNALEEPIPPGPSKGISVPRQSLKALNKQQVKIKGIKKSKKRNDSDVVIKASTIKNLKIGQMNDDDIRKMELNEAEAFAADFRAKEQDLSTGTKIKKVTTQKLRKAPTKKVLGLRDVRIPAGEVPLVLNRHSDTSVLSLTGKGIKPSNGPPKKKKPTVTIPKTIPKKLSTFSPSKSIHKKLSISPKAGPSRRTAAKKEKIEESTTSTGNDVSVSPIPLKKFLKKGKRISVRAVASAVAHENAAASGSEKEGGIGGATATKSKKK